MPDEIRVLIVDDHQVFCEALATSLSIRPGFAVVGYCSTVRDTVAAMASGAIDVVVLDYDLRVERGSAVVAWAEEHSFAGQILVLTASVLQPDALWLIQHRVAGLILKERALSDVAEAIRSVAQGGKWLDQCFLQLVMSAVSAGIRAPQGPVFNDRERSTLRHLVEGCANKEIAARLAISEAAVKSIIQKLFEKLGVRSRGHLIRVALQDYRNEL
jgi:DNA-binding NarL/FixJ family response regulator